MIPLFQSSNLNNSFQFHNELSPETNIQILKKYILNKTTLSSEENNHLIDRKEVIAHATLSAFLHHWPSSFDRLTFKQIKKLLAETHEIKKIEINRWMTQRKIAIAKISKSL